MGESLNNADKNSVRLFKQIKTFFGQHKYIPALAVVYILFHAFFENLFTVVLVKPFLSYLETSFLNDVIFVALTVLAIIYIRKVIDNHPLSLFYKRITDLFVFVIILIWSYYRFHSDAWIYTPFYLCDTCKYIDFIPVLSLSYFIKKKSLPLEKESPLQVAQKGFCFDSPLSKSDPDLLNRENLVRQVCERIQNTANIDVSFAIGVTSEWGNGKTSFLNLIERHLDKNKRVIIHYNPWLNSDRKSATLSFFDEMSSALKVYDSSLSNDILKYAKMLIDSSGGKYSNLLNACLSLDATPTLRERFEEINDAIKRTKLQIIVFIDDLDRLYDSEIVEVLSLIRNSANFSNTIFIVAYDRNYLVAALKKVNNYHPQAYLEKIFQLELPLPQFESHVLIEILQNKLNAYFDYYADCQHHNYEGYERDKIELNRALFDSKLFYSAGIKTIRDVNRLVNSFLVSYDSLKGEIIISDLLNVELLKIKYLGAYELLANKADEFLKPVSHSSSKETFLGFVKTDGNIFFWKYLEKYQNEASVSKHHLVDVRKYIKYLFPEKGHFSYKSICSPIGIKRYFHYSLLNDNFSQIIFDNLRHEKSDSNYWQYIEKHVNKTFELKEMLEGVIYNDDNDYKRIISSYLYLASKSSSEYRTLFFEGFWELFRGDKAKYFNSNSLVLVLDNNIVKLVSINFVNDMMNYIFKDIEFSRSNEAEMFLKFCAQNWFLVFVINIIQYNVYIIGNDIIDEEVKFYNIKPVISKIFQNWDKFESFINELDETRSKGLNEFKDFYQKLKEADFKEIKYDFKEIKLKD
jgi:hypothetical protein